MQSIRLALSLLAAAAGLSRSMFIATHRGGSATLASTNGAAGKRLDRRADIPTSGGAIDGTRFDILRTYGLSTCIGMAAYGIPNIPGDKVIDKVLSHVQCENGDGDINKWAAIVAAQNWPSVLIAVSVLNPNLLDPSLQDAQKELNRVALLAANNVSVEGLWAVRVVERQTQQGGDPLGTMRIEADGRTWAEGVEVLWPVLPNLNVNCYWPIKYTPSDATDEVFAEMEALSLAICDSAEGCYDNAGSPVCNFDAARPLGYCTCV